MTQHNLYLLTYTNEDDLPKLNGADSAPINCHLSSLGSAQAIRTKAATMPTGQCLVSKRKRPAIPFANSISGAFLYGVHPKKPTSLFVNAVTHTA